MQRHDQVPVPDLDQLERPAVRNIEDPVSDSNCPADKDCEKAYSTRKRRSAPRRYSPSPTWEIWENWKDSAAFSEGKRSEKGLAKFHNHRAKEKKSRPRNFSPAPSSWNGSDTTISNMTKSAVLSTKKKKIRKKSLSFARLDLKKTKSRFLSPGTTDSNEANDTSLHPASTNLNHSKANQSESSELKEKNNVRPKKRKYRKRTSNVKEERVYGTRSKRSAPKRYSPTHLSDRKMPFYLGVRTRSPTAAAGNSEAISVKWADVLKRTPYVLLERYVPPSTSLPLDFEEEIGLEYSSESECCTPTPSWMDEEEMASYYNSEMMLNVGRCSLSGSTDHAPTSVSPEQVLVGCDRSSCSPLLNDVAIASTLESDIGKYSATLALTINADETNSTLEDEFDTGTCSPIPLLDVNSIFTTLDGDLDLGECNRTPLLCANDTTDKDQSCPATSASVTILKGTSVCNIPKNEFGSLVSTDQTAVSAKYGSRSVPLLDDSAVSTMNNEQVPVPSLDDSAMSTMNNEQVPVPSLEDTAVWPTEKNELSPVPSLRAVVFQTENEHSLAPRWDIIAVAPIERSELSPVPLLDDTDTETNVKNLQASVLPFNDTAAAPTQSEKSSAPCLEDTSVAPVRESALIPIPVLHDTAVRTIQKIELPLVPPLDDTSVPTENENPSLDDTSVAPIRKNELASVSAVDDFAVSTAEKNALLPVLNDNAGNSTEKIKMTPVPLLDDTSVAPIRENELASVSALDDTGTALFTTKMNDMAPSSLDDSDVAPFPYLDDITASQIKKEMSSVPCSHDDGSRVPAEKTQLRAVQPLDGTAAGKTEKNDLTPTLSFDDTAVPVSVKEELNPLSLEKNESGALPSLDGLASMVKAEVTDEKNVSGLFPSSNEIAKTEWDASGSRKRVPIVAVVETAVDKTENSVSVPGPSFHGSSTLKCVPTATTINIISCPVSSSDESVSSKTETGGQDSRCVPPAVMVDASVDTTELFPFPALDSTAIVKTEKNGSVTRKCVSTSPLHDTDVETIVLDTKTHISDPSLSCSNAIETKKNREVQNDSIPPLKRTHPVTRQHRLNSERSSASKVEVKKSLDPTSCSPVVNKAPYVERNCSSYNPSNFTIKTESPSSKTESLILIRRDYVAPKSSSFSPGCSSSSNDYLDKNDHQSWQSDSKLGRYFPPTGTSESEPVRMNPDLTAEDVFDILFGQKNRGEDNVRNAIESNKSSGQSRKKKLRGDRDSKTRCQSPLSDTSTLTARETESTSLPSNRDAFEVGCGRKTYSPTLFRHNTRSRSPIPVNAVSPRPRKRPLSPAVSLPDRPSPTATGSTRSLMRRSLSNNFDESFQKPGRSNSTLSINDYESRTGNGTRKKRSAPKRYSPTASSYCDETTNSSAEDNFYLDNDKRPYSTRSTRSAPKRYSPTPFYDAYYYYDHKDEFPKKSLSETESKSENGNNRKLRRMSVKSVSGYSFKADDDSRWKNFHGSNCTNQCASLNIIRDTPVPRDVNDNLRAQKTAPPEVSVADSKIPDAGNGAWASEAIPARTRFGPYEGRIVPAEVSTSYAWLIRKNGKPDRCVDATEPGLSNWMRFVNCARHDGEQNLEAFQCRGNIYYKTTREVNPHEELLVWYGDDYGRQLGIDPKVCDEEDEESWREKNFKCPGCPLAFASPLYLQSHKRVCRDLKSSAGSSKELKRTLKSKKKNNPVKVRKSNSQLDLTQKDSVKSYRGPMQLEPSGRAWKKLKRKNPKEDGGYFCESCNIHFLRKYHWERHLESKKHRANEPYACSQCDKRFRNKFSLLGHMKAHTREKPYACLKCNRRFSDVGNLKKHVDNHSDKNRLVCSDCKMEFSEKGSLKKHCNRKHNKSGSDRLACNRCTKRYCDKQSLKRHQRIHNGEKPFACFVCNKRFSRRQVLKTHLKIHRIASS